MGADSSKHDPWFTLRSTSNDYELVIRASKELEYVLEHDFGGVGKGLHEKISTSKGLSPKLVQDMRYIATIRNKLIHERGFDAIPARTAFLDRFETSARELERRIQERRIQKGGVYSSTTSCIIC
jgi:hypothetical protein